MENYIPLELLFNVYTRALCGGILCINDSTGQVLNDAGGDPLVVAGGSCSAGVPADSTNESNTRGGGNRTVIVGREDVLTAAQFVCEVANIPD